MGSTSIPYRCSCSVGIVYSSSFKVQYQKKKYLPEISAEKGEGCELINTCLGNTVLRKRQRIYIIAESVTQRHKACCLTRRYRIPSLVRRGIEGLEVVRDENVSWISEVGCVLCREIRQTIF